MKTNGIQSVPTNEDDVNTVLDALRRLEEYGFIFPVPEIIRTSVQPRGILIMESVRDLGDDLKVMCRATLTRTAEFQEKRTLEVGVCERVGDAIEGRTEIAIIRDLSGVVWRWSVRIGKNCSIKIGELCKQRGLDLNRIVAVSDEVIDEERVFIVLGAIARWANQFLFLI
jgi:hypothetical protein